MSAKGKMFSVAIVRRPCKAMVDGITSNPGLGKPDYRKAREQHEAYVAALGSCGVEVRVLKADERFPDSCFVEDVAVCTRPFAMVTRPGAPSRQGETGGIGGVLREYFDRVEAVAEPGTLEGGDVMMVGDRFYVGLSSRTNREGAGQLVAALGRHGLSGTLVDMPDILHLKTGLSYLEEGVLLATREFIGLRLFKDLTKIEIPDDEAYAANCIRVNDRVLVPAGFPETERRIRAAGFAAMTVDTSEYRKLDGGLSCLSLRF
jgi:dimethylargininase